MINVILCHLVSFKYWVLFLIQIVASVQNAYNFFRKKINDIIEVLF